MALIRLSSEKGTMWQLMDVTYLKARKVRCIIACSKMAPMLSSHKSNTSYQDAYHSNAHSLEVSHNDLGAKIHVKLP